MAAAQVDAALMPSREQTEIPMNVDSTTPTRQTEGRMNSFCTTNKRPEEVDTGSCSWLRSTTVYVPSTQCWHELYLGAWASLQDQLQGIPSHAAWNLWAPNKGHTQEQQGPGPPAGSHPSLERWSHRHHKNLFCSNWFPKITRHIKPMQRSLLHKTTSCTRETIQRRLRSHKSSPATWEQSRIKSNLHPPPPPPPQGEQGPEALACLQSHQSTFPDTSPKPSSGQREQVETTGH